jgi:hypothetical protein
VGEGLHDTAEPTGKQAIADEGQETEDSDDNWDVVVIVLPGAIRRQSRDIVWDC